MSRPQPFPAAMVLTPASRNPLRLPESTVEAIRGNPAAALPETGQTGCGHPETSIIIVTFNSFLFTRMCLESVLANTAGFDYEIVIVDNGSTDDTPDYIRAMTHSRGNFQVILNPTNRGFAPAVNQGLAAAKADRLVLLNNDTVVTPGWLPRLMAHLDDPAVGMVGPVTNRTGNEAQIETTYQTYGELLAFSEEQAAKRDRERFDIPILTMFCAAMRRDVYRRVGTLDESFQVGLFEDDDYSLRVRSAGYRVVCAEDTFIHHFSGASFGVLAAAGQYGELFHSNRQRWEEKWKRKWVPHKHRPNKAYEELVEQIRTIARDALPPGGTVAVVTKGDAGLLELEGRTAWHFPRSEDGEYAGYYPADSAQARAELEALRSKGAEFFMIPAPSLWWLRHYEEFGSYLRSSFPLVTAMPDACLIFDLRRR